MQRMTSFFFVLMLLMPSVALTAFYPVPLPGSSNNVMVSNGSKWTAASAAPVCTATAITDDTTTNATMYPTWVTTASGNQSQKVTSSKLTYNPSTGTLATTTFSGAHSGNSTTATALAANGANCSAGQYPLGVDASGAAESCAAITALGTIATGVWNGTAVSTTYGGLGINSSGSTGFYYDTAGTASVKTATQSTALLDAFVGDSGSGGTKGLVPAPASGDAAAGKYLKADGSFAVPPGSGSGGINYISPNHDAEGNATTGWANYADAAATSPVDGTAGSPTTVISVSSTTPLRGTYSYKWVKSANNRQGEGTSFDFTIAKADQGQVLSIDFDYLISSGTFVDDDMEVWIYNVTDTVLQQPAPYKILNTGVPQHWHGTFQASTSSTSYRLIFHTSSTSASAYTLQWDNVTVGPQAKSYGPLITDSTAYTPTTQGFGTETNVAVKYVRRGNMLMAWGKLTTGTVGASEVRIGLPSGLSIDTSIASLQVVGYLRRSGAVTVSNHNVIGNGGLTYVNVGGGNAGNGTSSVEALTAQNGSTIFNNTETESFWFEVPIQGWSSGMLLSADADTRVVAAKYNLTSSQVFTNTVVTTVIWNSKVIDTHGGGAGATVGMDTSTGKYYVPVPGYYRVTSYIRGASAATNINHTLDIRKNNNQSQKFDIGWAGNSSSQNGIQITDLISCVAGDYISVAYRQSQGSDYTSSSTATDNWIAIEKVSGPSQIAASESVNARYYASATSISGSLATISWTTKDYDSHGAMSSGTYTVPVSGKYQVNSYIANSGTFVLNNLLTIEIQKNGTVVSRGKTYAGGATTQMDAGVADTISCIAGDTIRIQVSNSGTGPAIVSSNFENWVSISRVGN